MSKKFYDTFDLKKFDVTRRYDDDVFDPYEGVTWRDHLLLYMIGAVFLIFILWANFATLEEVTRGQGTVIPSSQVKVIQNLEGGIIDSIMVREGDSVKKGDVLVQMRNVLASSEFSSSESRYLGLKTIVQRLRAESEGADVVEFTEDVITGVPESVENERSTFRAKRSQIQSQLSVLQQQESQRQQEVAELNRRISDTQRIVGLSQQEMNMLRPAVERGAAPEMELLQLERSIAQSEAELNGLRLALPRANSAVSEIRERINEVKSTAKADAQRELAERIVEMNSIRENLTALEDRKDRTQIVSPVDGTVVNIQFTTEGGVVQPGEKIMEVVPVGDNLLIEANIQPSDIAFLYQGQKAVVKITAYDYTIYGGLEGEVENISANTITDQTPQGEEEFYQMLVRTDETVIRHNGETLLIKPGMKAQVDVLTGEKTVMDYLLKPFKKASQTAMRER